MSSPVEPTSDVLIVLEHLSEGVSQITLNRPDKRNAMNRAAQFALVKAFSECRGRAKAIVLTGSGPAFCAGVDLKEAAASGTLTTTGSEPSVSWQGVQEEIRRHPAIVIAAVNGYALGGGVTLINCADLGVAAEDAQIGMPEIGFGVYPALAGPSTQLRVSPKRAAWMVLTAQRIDGRTAESWGLVNLAVPRDLVLSTAIELAQRIAQFDAVTLEWSKRALWEVPMHLTDWSSALQFGEVVNAMIREHSQAQTEGLNTFAKGERRLGQGTA